MPEALPLVVGNNMCVGCGGCAVASDGAIAMGMDETGCYTPHPSNGGNLIDLPAPTLRAAGAVCPFAPGVRNETSLSEELFAGDGVQHEAVTGYYRKIVAGHVAEDDYRDAGTSGGMTTWVLTELLEQGVVDGVVHVASTHDGSPNPLSRYRVSRTVAEIHAGRKSRYHVQTLESVMAEVRSSPGRYAVVGVPCFIKAVRLLGEQDAVIKERVVFTAALFCGHYKSRLYSDYVAQSVGFRPSEVDDIDYRYKVEGRPPNRYCMKVDASDGRTEVRGAEEIPLANWGIGLFKLGGCDYCDDISGETADISLGDAWAPPFMSDWRGANLAVARSELAARLIENGIESGALDVTDWTPGQVSDAQGGAVRHRRRGLSVRLAARLQCGQWVPEKRVEPATADEISSPFGQRMLNREAVSVGSIPAYLRTGNDLDAFRAEMAPLVAKYDGSRTSTAWRRAATWLILRLPPRVETWLRAVAKTAKLT